MLLNSNFFWKTYVEKILPNGDFGDFRWLFWRISVLILLILLATCTFWRENSKYWPLKKFRLMAVLAISCGYFGDFWF